MQSYTSTHITIYLCCFITGCRSKLCSFSYKISIQSTLSSAYVIHNSIIIGYFFIFFLLILLILITLSTPVSHGFLFIIILINLASVSVFFNPLEISSFPSCHLIHHSHPHPAYTCSFLLLPPSIRRSGPWMKRLHSSCWWWWWVLAWVWSSVVAW